MTLVLSISRLTVNLLNGFKNLNRIIFRVTPRKTLSTARVTSVKNVRLAKTSSPKSVRISRIWGFMVKSDGYCYLIYRLCKEILQELYSKTFPCFWRVEQCVLRNHQSVI